MTGVWTEAPWVNVGVLTLSTPVEGGYYTDSDLKLHSGALCSFN